MVSVSRSFRPGREVAGAKDCPSIILDQHRLPGQHHDKFVLSIMPMALAGPGPGLERDMADPEVG